MFNIVSITTASGNNTSILLGGPAGKELIGPHGPLGPEGSSYVLAFPGLGYIKFDDVGGKGNHLFDLHFLDMYALILSRNKSGERVAGHSKSVARRPTGSMKVEVKPMLPSTEAVDTLSLVVPTPSLGSCEIFTLLSTVTEWIANRFRLHSTPF